MAMSLTNVVRTAWLKLCAAKEVCCESLQFTESYSVTMIPLFSYATAYFGLLMLSKNAFLVDGLIRFGFSKVRICFGVAIFTPLWFARKDFALLKKSSILREGEQNLIDRPEGLTTIVCPRHAAIHERNRSYRFVNTNRVLVEHHTDGTTETVGAFLPNIYRRQLTAYFTAFEWFCIPVVVRCSAVEVVDDDHLHLHSKYNVHMGATYLVNLPLVGPLLWYFGQGWLTSGLRAMNVSKNGNTAFVNGNNAVVACPNSYHGIELPFKIYDHVTKLDKPSLGALKHLTAGTGPLLSDYEWFSMLQHLELPIPALLFTPWICLLAMRPDPAIGVPVDGPPPIDVLIDDDPIIIPQPAQARNLALQPPPLPPRPVELQLRNHERVVLPGHHLRGGYWEFVNTDDIDDALKPQRRRMLKALFMPIVDVTWGAPVLSTRALETMRMQRYWKYPQLVPILNNKEKVDDYLEMMRVFVRMCMEDRKLGPVTHQEVEEAQARPAQKNILRNGAQKARKFATKKFAGFPKSEAYGTPKPIRPIVNFPAHVKAKYASYTMALGNHMKNNPRFHWYGFGANQTDTAAKVCAKAKGKKTVSETDYTAFDVTVNVLIRALERVILEEAFEKPEEVLELHQMQYAKGATLLFEFDGHDIDIDPQYGRHSGSPETSLFNSWINGFIAFYTYHKMLSTDVNNNNTNGITQTAFDKLGLYAGDDGISFDIDGELYQRVAEELGLKMKCDVIDCGNVFKFLSKEYYSCTWTGVNACYASVAERVLGKVHLAGKGGKLTLDEQIYLRGKSYHEQDPDCPLIGCLGIHLMRIAHAKLKAAKKWERITLLDAAIKQSKTANTNDELLIDGDRLDTYIGYRGLGRGQLCNGCVKFRLDKCRGYNEWALKLETVSNYDELPCLKLNCDQPVWSSTWTKLHYSDPAGMNLVKTEVGSEPPMPTIAPRKRFGNGYLDAMHRKRSEPAVEGTPVKAGADSTPQKRKSAGLKTDKPKGKAHFSHPKERLSQPRRKSGFGKA